MPWKNGQGETVEIARSPDGEGLDDFDWRVSVAPVVADGAFSMFPGIERTIAVIEGSGMALDVAGLSVALRPGVPFTYDGPQTDDLGPEFRRSDGDHFNEAGVRQLGIRFARHLTRAFFPPPIPAPMPPRDAAP